MGQTVVAVQLIRKPSASHGHRAHKLGQRERLLVLEIDRDRIDTASGFVDYISSEYGFSKSSVWYNLKRLKELGVLDFATRDEVGKPLSLTEEGLAALVAIEPERAEIESRFSRAQPMQPAMPQGIGRISAGLYGRVFTGY